jgi:hypothetical protein
MISQRKFRWICNQGSPKKYADTACRQRDTDANSYLRRGVIFIALSLPIIFSLVIGENYQEAAIFGGIALCAGLAYLLVLTL